MGPTTPPKFECSNFASIKFSTSVSPRQPVEVVVEGANVVVAVVVTGAGFSETVVVSVVVVTVVVVVVVVMVVVVIVVVVLNSVVVVTVVPPSLHDYGNLNQQHNSSNVSTVT